MKKQTFLLLISIYSTLIGIVLMFAPNLIFQTYGFPTIDQIPYEVLIGTAKDFIFYTGANALALGVLYYLSIKGANNKAVLYLGGKSIVTIKFTRFSNEKICSIARVRQLNGVDANVPCEPLKDYETIISLNCNVKWKSYLTGGGIVNNSIEKDMAGFFQKNAWVWCQNLQLIWA